MFHKAFIVLWFFVNGLGAYDFKHCQAFFQKASLQKGGVALKELPKGVYLYYSKTYPKHAKVIKSDPFVGLYLLQGVPSEYVYTLRDLDKDALIRSMASIGDKEALEARLLFKQKGYERYAQISQKTQKNGVISNICYQMLGLGVGGNGFIETKFIKHFLNQKEPYYGDIGVRLEENNKRLVVAQFDPFFPKNPFLKNDEILAINHQKIHSLAEFEWVVSNLKYQSLVKVEIKRNHKIKEVTLKVNKRYGGFLLKDTFLERYGIALDERFIITKIGTHLPKGLDFLKLGDRILWVNRKNVASNPKALREALSAPKIELLVLRKGFEFYIKVR
ncbi:PDZ domain-containing protein [Helicobacter pylori]|uniref:PDZ domain-containing protein n=1 Tax=Helicobacter pylori TaxID=210 RepID=UPI00292A0748|nr:PDZ domain-containing protein [Helicobacter pylori]MDU9702544.1 PDZ domain-containing protein [Helicobacter pylori]